MDNLTPAQRKFLEDPLIDIEFDSDLPPQLEHFKAILSQYPEEDFVIYNDEATDPILVAHTRNKVIFRCAKCKALDGVLRCQVCHHSDIKIFKLQEAE
jgi:hypothetical protein